MDLTANGSKSPSPSLVVFGPQETEWPSKEDFSDLRATLINNPSLQPLREAIAALPRLWASLEASDRKLRRVPGVHFIHSLVRWVDIGEAPRPSDILANVLFTPLTVIIHIVRYVRHVSRREDDTSHESILASSTKGGGIQGFCTGLLSAIAVGCSKNENDIGKFAATALRLAVCIGAYVDLDGAFADPPRAMACLAVRWRAGSSNVDEIGRICSGYPSAYISVITDSTTVTLTASLTTAIGLEHELTAKGMQVKHVELQGRFHSRFLEGAAEKVIRLCHTHSELQFPHVNRLLSPLRSNTDTQRIGQGNLHEIAIRSLLTELADWRSTMAKAMDDLRPNSNPMALVVGPASSVPKAEARRCNLKVTTLSRSGNREESPRPDASAVTPGTVTPLERNTAASNNSYPEHAVAVIGMGCKFPGADSLSEFWDVIRNGTSHCQRVPRDRFVDTDLRRTPDSKGFFGNFVNDIESFDHRFFKKSSREATSMDPQQRQLLQVAYHTLESAGWLSSDNSNKDKDCGCYIGVCANDYNDNVASHPPTAFSSLGTLRAFLSGKISHHFGWMGPSVTFDTACSSSAVAVDAACKAIAIGDCSSAIAGGVNLFTNPNFFQNLQAGTFLSPTGSTKAFDAAADGYCRGEGVGLVLLKKLSNALADRDNILGVIRGSAVNQNNNATYITVPHSPSQVQLYQKVLQMSRLKAQDVSFVEAHGTGTPVGDPIECESIRQVFGGSGRAEKLFLGSVKGNIGHTEGASGVAALIKAVLMIQHGVIPIQANFTKLNPKIAPLDTDRMAIPTSSQEWSSSFRAALINNYGAAGSNAAMLVCQPPSPALAWASNVAAPPAERLQSYPIYLSAATRSALQSVCASLETWVSNNLRAMSADALLASIAFNLSQKANRALPFVITKTVHSLEELRSLLSAAASGKSELIFEPPSKTLPVVLAFSGQFSTYVGLSQALFWSSARLREHLDQCDRILRSTGFPSIYPSLFQQTAVKDVVILHSIIFSMQYASAMTKIESGLKVDALVGHSFGQLTALCVSGAMSLNDGLRLVGGRAALMTTHWGSEAGSMISVEANTDSVMALVEAMQPLKIEIACFNAPTSHVLVGKEEAISRLESVLQQEPRFTDIKSKRLNITHGFHSQFTEPLLPHLETLAASLNFQEPTIHCETCSNGFSWTTLSSKLITAHTRDPVHFGQAVQRLANRLGPCSWVDASFGSPIIGMVRRALGASASSHQLQTARSGSVVDVDALVQSTSKLWEWGYKVQFWPFDRIQKDEYDHLDLPPYPFEKSRHWLTWEDYAKQPASQPIITQAPIPEKPVLIKTLKSSGGVSEFIVDPRSEEWKLYVGGHAVLAMPLCPAPLYAELVARAAFLVAEGKGPSDLVLKFDRMEIQAPLGLDPNREILMTLKRATQNSQTLDYVVKSHQRGDQSAEPTQHATGSVTLTPTADPECDAELSRFNRLINIQRSDALLQDSDAESMRGSLIYKTFARVVTYAEYYKGVKSVSARNHEVGGLVTLPAHQIELLKNTTCLPLALDNFVQVAGLHVNSLVECDDNEVWVCTKIGRVQSSTSFQSSTAQTKSWTVYSKYANLNDKEITNDIFVFDPVSKELVMFILDAHFTRVLIRSLTRVLARANPGTGESLSAPQPKAAEQISRPSAKTVTPPTAKPVSQKKKKSEGLEQAIFALLARVADIDAASIKRDSELADLGIDSLMSAELLREIKLTFNIEVAPEEFQDVVDVKSLCENLSPRVPGLSSDSVESSPEENDFTSSDPSTAEHSGASSSTGLTTPSDSDEAQDTLYESLSQLVCQTLETSSSMCRETCLADEGLDSLIGVELINDIEKKFGAKVELTTETTFGDLFDVVSASQPRQAKPQAITSKSKSTMPQASSTQPSKPEMSISKSTSDGPPVSNAHKAFHDVQEDYEKYAKETGFANFWTETYPTQAKLVVAYTVEAFESLGCPLREMQAGTSLPAFQYLEKHKLLVNQLYEILADASLISKVNGSYVRTNKSISQQPASELFQYILQSSPQHASEHKLLNITGSRLADCLTGSADPLQLLFRSQANRELLEDVYTNGPMYEAVTKQLGSFLLGVFSSSSSREPFYILEVGGGTGGTTKYILELLSSYNIPIIYTFTDLSPSLVTAAKKKFAKYGFVQYQTLDVEKEPPEALKGRFHAVLSTNCVHATKDLKVSTNNIRKILRPDGFLSVVEFTKNMFWFDLVFGLLDGWWFFIDGREHVLADEYFWRRSMTDAGYEHVDWTKGAKQESNTLRIITAFQTPSEIVSTSKSDRFRGEYETIVFKQTGQNLLYTDIYYPAGAGQLQQKRPIALLFHGGGHMMLSRKDINPSHVKELLDQGFLPISMDFRLCPELNLIEGPMEDACDAMSWARSKLPKIQLRYPGLQPDGNRVVCVGWSAGGHLAMTTAWTAPSRGIKAPEAVTSFYCPTDYEDKCWTEPNFPGGTKGDSDQSYDLLEGVGPVPITQYNLPPANRPLNGWLSLPDPRSRIILHANWKGQALPILLNGLPSKSSTPAPDQTNFSSMPIPPKDAIASISPCSQIRQGTYKTPTYIAHGTDDDLIPWQQSQRTYEALRGQGVSAEVTILKDSPHLFDLFGNSNEEMKAVRDGFAFLARHV